MKSNFPLKVVLKILTGYLGFTEFVGPTIIALNGILSGFIFFINLIDGDHEQKLISYLLYLFSYHH